MAFCRGSRSVTPPRPGPSGSLGVLCGFGQVPPLCLSVIVYRCPLYGHNSPERLRKKNLFLLSSCCFMAQFGSLAQLVLGNFDY